MVDRNGERYELPAEYARKRARERLAPWWRGEAGDALRVYGPRIWPGVPPVVLLGWSVTSTGPRESGPEPDHVRGLWGVERSRLDGLAKLARPYLGREVRIGTEERRYLDDVEAQVVCGLLTYRKHLDGLLDDLDADVVAALGRDTAAAARVASMAYSSGGGKVEPLLDMWGRELLALPVAKWSRELAARVADFDGDVVDPPGRGRSVKVGGRWNAAETILRAERRALAACFLGDLVLSELEAVSVRKWVGDWAEREPEVCERLAARMEGGGRA